MSKVNVEPFYFGEDDGIQINPEQFPGAVQPSSENQDKDKEAKPVVTDKEETPENVTIEDPEDDQDDVEDVSDPLGFFNKSNKKSDKKETEEKPEKLTSDKIDYKAFSDFLVETEVWKDFEGREDIEYSEETFQALWKAQAENATKEILLDERSQFPDTANQLVDFLKAGGTVDDFVGNYTQQLEVSSLDTSDEYGQEKAVKEYYKSIDWSDAKIKRHIERLKDSGDSDFKEEAEDCKAKLVSAIESERIEMIKEQEAIAQDRKIRAEAFNKAVRENIYKDPNLAEREKKDLDKFIYDYKFQDNQGNKYSEFMVRMNEINQDPKKYQKFLKFIKNMDAYEDKKIAEAEATKKQFNFLKEGGNPLSGVVSKEPEKRKQTNTPQGFKFK